MLLQLRQARGGGHRGRALELGCAIIFKWGGCDAALEAGHDVILISGPVNLAPPSNAKFVSVSTSDEMFDAMHRYADSCDVCVLCAAVADYKPAKASPTKIKKRDERFSLELVRTRDILESLGQQRDRPFLLVGFAAETNEVEKKAAKKKRH